MMEQEVKYLHIKDLVLWTENPRDLIDINATDQDIVNQAIKNRSGKWNLEKLAKEMGDNYDCSELPTVVFYGNEPVVYDGNRRIILGKILHGLVVASGVHFKLPIIPMLLPCNVCSLPIALRNIYRKHAESGSWGPLERDIFLYKHMHEKKSEFLVLDEATGIISNNKHMNQVFVKEEIFKDTNLRKLGIQIINDRLHSKHTPHQTELILKDISEKIILKKISTRKNRGKIVEVLDPQPREIIVDNEKNPFTVVDIRPASKELKEDKKKSQKTRRANANVLGIFGGTLNLKFGNVNDFYRDILDLYNYYLRNIHQTKGLRNLIRMSLRLLAEIAAKDTNVKLDYYLRNNFKSAKKMLSQDLKTGLSNHNVMEGTIIQLMHTGAHEYDASSNLDQTLYLSVIVGAIITLTHGKNW